MGLYVAIIIGIFEIIGPHISNLIGFLKITRGRPANLSIRQEQCVVLLSLPFPVSCLAAEAGYFYVNNVVRDLCRLHIFLMAPNGSAGSVPSRSC